MESPQILSQVAKSIIVCNICDDILEEPVAIPCNRMICKKHLAPSLACPFCSKCHALSFVELKKLAAVVKNLDAARKTVASTAQLYGNVQFNADLLIDECVRQVRAQINTEKDVLLAKVSCAIEANSDQLVQRLDTMRQELHEASENANMSRLALNLNAETLLVRDKIARWQADLEIENLELSEPLWAQIRSEALSYKSQVETKMRAYTNLVFGSRTPAFLLANRPDLIQAANFGELIQTPAQVTQLRTLASFAINSANETTVEPAAVSPVSSPNEHQQHQEYLDRLKADKAVVDQIFIEMTTAVDEMTTNTALESSRTTTSPVPTNVRFVNRNDRALQQNSPNSSSSYSSLRKRMLFLRKQQAKTKKYAKKKQRALGRSIRPSVQQPPSPMQRRLFVNERVCSFNSSYLNGLDLKQQRSFLRAFVRDFFGTDEFAYSLYYPEMKFARFVCTRHKTHNCVAKLYLFVTEGYGERVDNHTCVYRKAVQARLSNGPKNKNSNKNYNNKNKKKNNNKNNQNNSSADKRIASEVAVSGTGAVQLNFSSTTRLNQDETVTRRFAHIRVMTILHPRFLDKSLADLVFVRPFTAPGLDALDEKAQHRYMRDYVRAKYVPNEFKVRRYDKKCAHFVCCQRLEQSCRAELNLYAGLHYEERIGVHTCGYKYSSGNGSELHRDSVVNSRLLFEVPPTEMMDELIDNPLISTAATSVALAVDTSHEKRQYFCSSLLRDLTNSKEPSTNQVATM